MLAKVHSVPRPEWSAVPRAGCRNVEARVLLSLPALTVVQLRFGADATIDEHAVGWDIDVICLEGEGTTSVDGDAETIREGQTIRWPAGKRHGLFTGESTMVTLMVEQVGSATRPR